MTAHSPKGADMPADESSITRFLRSFPGEVLRPTDAGFPRARAEAIWNGAITRQPALIVRPASTGEVASTVSSIREAGADVTVRGGGHSPAARSVTPASPASRSAGGWDG
jgi:hypothetical protein